MSYFIVSHNAALALLAHIPNPRFGDSEPEVVSIAGACALSDQEAQEVIDRYDLGIDTLDLLVPSRADRRRSKHVKTHLCTNELPAGSFISLGHWMGDLDAYVCSPELAFLQAAHDGDAAAAIYAGYAMTSDYRLDNLAPGGVTSRDAGMRDGRLTTKELIAAYLDRASKVGAPPRRRRCFRAWKRAHGLQGSRGFACLCRYLRITAGLRWARPN